MSYRERALVALVLSITVVLLMSRGHAQGDRYVPADCFDNSAVHASLTWMLTQQVRSPLVDEGDAPYWDCQHDGIQYRPDVLHVSAALANYGPPYDDLQLSHTSGNLDPAESGLRDYYIVHDYTEANPYVQISGMPARLLIATDDYIGRCYSRGWFNSKYIPMHYLDRVPCERSPDATQQYEDMYRELQRADKAYLHPWAEWFRDPFEPFVKQALADGLEGSNPWGSDNPDDGTGDGTGGDLGDGSGAETEFDDWRPLGDTSDAFAGMRDCVGDAFTHLFQVAQQQMPIMFGEWIPEGMSIDESDTPDCTDTSITLLGHTEELPLCDNPIMKNLRRVIRPVLLLVALVQFYIGITRLIAWS